MVRLSGRISEKRIVPTHTRVIIHGQFASATATEQPATTNIATGLSSVKRGWAMYNMKVNIATALHMARPEGVATSGGKMYIGNILTIGGNVTIDWFAIGDPTP